MNPLLLSSETLNRFERVPEFEFIIQEANKLGVKVYLFGGTASAFAHYVRWDLERKAGDTKYQAERFDYDFTNIYRGNQDLDIVVDGTPEQADQLKEILRQEYPHFVGSREAWEVRLLRESRGDKRALLGDEDFKKQHSDTNSTGMLLLNPDPQGIVYNDLLEWGSYESDFLNDVAAARIKFLYSDEHEGTERFKNGFNPPVLAAIRYLAKLAQYEVEGTAKDLKIVTQIIAETDFTKLSSYGKKKAEEFALKTLLNAPDSEYAWNLLERTGARTKLIEMDKERLHNQDTLSWWMNKEPLRSKDFGTEGKTAREIFGTDKIIVSHETLSFKAYDNITRSSKGGANAFISRIGIAGEAAQYGEGFYTKVGLEGARGTGLTIRFELHPDAREGQDFTLSATYVIVKNKRALKLIQENINLSLLDFLKLLRSGDIGTHDKGLIEKFMRKFTRISSQGENFQQAKDFVKQSFHIEDLYGHDTFDISKIDQATQVLQLVNFLTKVRLEFHKKVLSKLQLYNKEKKLSIADHLLQEELISIALFIDEELKEAHWIDSPELIEKIIESKKGGLENLIRSVLSQTQWTKYPYLIEKLLEKNQSYINKLLIKHIFSQKEWSHKEAWLEPLLVDTRYFNEFAEHILSKPHWQHKTNWVMIILEKGNLEVKRKLIAKAFIHDYWTKHPELIQSLIKNNSDEGISYDIIQYILSQKHWTHKEEWVEFFLEQEKYDEQIIIYILSQKHWVHRADWLETIFDHVNKHLFKTSWPLYSKIKNLLYKTIAKHILSQPHWSHKIEWFDLLTKDENTYEQLFQYVLSQPYWVQKTDWVETLVEDKNGNYDQFIARYLLSRSHWAHRTDWLEKIIKRGLADEEIAMFVLSQDHWQDRTDLIELLIDKNSVDSTLVTYVLPRLHWVEGNKMQTINAFVEKLLEKKNVLTDRYIAEELIKREQFTNPIWVRTLLNRTKPPLYALTQALSEPHWSGLHPEFVEKLLNINDSDHTQFIAEHYLDNPNWSKYPELVANVLDQDVINDRVKEELLSFSHWKHHPEFVEYLNGEPVNLTNWQAQKINFSQWYKNKKIQLKQCSGFL